MNRNFVLKGIGRRSNVTHRQILQFVFPRVRILIISNKSNLKVSFTIIFLFFVLGDSRVNQNLGIALFQNVFLRFHNIVAYDLKRFNPFWRDEEIYQETRRIVIAVIQHITYTHYLPILLGRH